jgi:glycosyltransferase A (GT-A) superfamily protein (DUF2064 family)
VIGPAEDGGYWLLALNAPVPPALFDAIRWSHAQTRADLEAQLRAFGLDVCAICGACATSMWRRI